MSDYIPSIIQNALGIIHEASLQPEKPQTPILLESAEKNHSTSENQYNEEQIDPIKVPPKSKPADLTDLTSKQVRDKNEKKGKNHQIEDKPEKVIKKTLSEAGFKGAHPNNKTGIFNDIEVKKTGETVEKTFKPDSDSREKSSSSDDLTLKEKIQITVPNVKTKDIEKNHYQIATSSISRIYTKKTDQDPEKVKDEKTGIADDDKSSSADHGIKLNIISPAQPANRITGKRITILEPEKPATMIKETIARSQTTLVIGKLTVEVINPQKEKEQPVQVQERIIVQSTLQEFHGNDRPGLKIKYGLGQM